MLLMGKQLSVAARKMTIALILLPSKSINDAVNGLLTFSRYIFGDAVRGRYRVLCLCFVRLYLL